MSTHEQWRAAAEVVSSDPWLKAPTEADRALVEAVGHTVDETVAGAA